MKLRRWLPGLLAFLPLLFVAFAALAQTVTSTLSAEPTPTDLFDAGAKVYNDWRSAGALAGVIALVKLFVDVTKLRVVDDWLWDHTWRWVRPVAALLLGGLVQMSAALTMKANPVVGFIYGVLAGASSIGINEFVTMFKDRKLIKEDEAEDIAAHEAAKRRAA